MFIGHSALTSASGMLAARATASTFAPLARITQTRSFFGFFQKWNKRLIYPPGPHEITTKNRLFPTYVENDSELHDLLISKSPLILNFTYPGDPKCNKLTQSLFDVLGDAKRYPLESAKFPVNLANIACDAAGGRDLLLTYAVGQVPTLLLLHKQMPVDKFQPRDLDSFKEQELINWIKSSVGR